VTDDPRRQPLDARQAAFVPSGQYAPALTLDIERTRKRLEAAVGGYEIVHASPGLEVGVYVLVAPEPDHQQPHADDELYYVLDGSGVLEIEGQPVPLEQGQAVFVPAGAHHQFTAYEHLSVLVVFARRWHLTPEVPERRAP
jgi:mannose-6-phosphate isomerase-like protein (cupin superfamily)